MRRVDVKGAGVGLDEGFQRGEIVGPVVFGIAAPFANGGSGAFHEVESAFVAGSFDDGVIAGFQKSVIKKKNGFFGGGHDEDIGGANFLVRMGDGFAKPRGAGSFGVTAPVFEERIVGARLEGEQIGNGLRFAIGRGQQIFGGEFVFAEIFFDAEGSNLHQASVAREGEGVQNQIDRRRLE